ncbi:MAG: hypothetical protein ACYSWU_04690 [Planctomycetota bacterium]
MTPRPKRPKPALTVRTYGELDRFVRAFAEAKFNLLIIVGRSGLQKTRVVRAAVGSDACWIDGNATAFGMYMQLWRYRDNLVVIDDVDSLYADRASVRLLKCLCQTEVQKRVAWHSDATTLDREGIPREFVTRSRVLIIANQWQTLNANVAAIEDRGHVVLFAPSALEVHLCAAKWFWDQETFDFVGRWLHLISEASMRDYWKAWELKQANLD